MLIFTDVSTPKYSLIQLTKELSEMFSPSSCLPHSSWDNKIKTRTHYGRSNGENCDFPYSCLIDYNLNASWLLFQEFRKRNHLIKHKGNLQLMALLA